MTYIPVAGDLVICEGDGGNHMHYDQDGQPLPWLVETIVNDGRTALLTFHTPGKGWACTHVPVPELRHVGHDAELLAELRRVH